MLTNHNFIQQNDQNDHLITIPTVFQEAWLDRLQLTLVDVFFFFFFLRGDLSIETKWRTTNISILAPSENKSSISSSDYIEE